LKKLLRTLRQKNSCGRVHNGPDEEREVAPKWIESRQTVSPGKLEDASQPISQALA
jgi:hypothetical protein